MILSNLFNLTMPHIAMSRDKALEVIKEGLARIYLRGQELDTQD